MPRPAPPALPAAILSVPLVAAFPQYQDEIPNGKHVTVSGQPWPGVGHSASAGSGPRNAFGEAFAAAGHTWTPALCQADADQDGYSNGAELGDPDCTWNKGGTPTVTTGISHPGDASSTPGTEGRSGGGAQGTPPSPASGTSLYDRIGGAASVDAAVELFYTKVLADASLQPLFASVSMGRLKTMQKAFLTFAFGGPGAYTGRSIREAHQGKGITDAHFNSVAGHLSATLTELGVPTAEHDEAMGIAGSVKGDVVTPSAPSASPPAAGSPASSLYGRIGGAAAVDAAVELFYTKVLADESLAPLFAPVAMGRLKTMQKAFLTFAFGGPSAYSGRSIRDAHKGKGITDAHFNSVAGHLSTTLIELGVPTAEHDEAIAIAASVKGDVVVSDGPFFAAHGEWSYVNPEDWYTTFPECAGSLQSPIELTSSDSTCTSATCTTAEAARPAFMRMYMPRIAPTPLPVTNNGHSLKIDMSTRRITLSSNLFWSQFTLAQIHYHSPSEHTINGKRYPAERHMVFLPSDHASLPMVGKKRYPLVVLGEVYEMSASESDPMLDMLMKGGVGSSLGYMQTVEVPAAAPPEFQMLNDESFNYPGSLTTPPCSEVVYWTVSSKPKPASAEQLTMLQQMTEHMHGSGASGSGPPWPSTHMATKGNARPIQPTNGRTVKFRSYFSQDFPD